MSDFEAVRFDLRPYHAMRALVGLWVALALFAWHGAGCWLIAALYLCAECYTRTQRTDWPADVQEYLAKRGWALPRNMPEVVDRDPPIPFRPMTIAELYRGAVKIVLQNWPTLVAVPAVIHGGFVVAVTAIAYVVGQILGSPQTASMFLGRDGDLRPGAAVLMLAIFMVLCAVVFPGDGLLISLVAQAADKAVRGERIRFDEMVHRAKQSELAVGRLIVVCCLIVAAMALIQVAAVVSGFYIALIPVVVVCGVASVVIGILLSMAPVVLVLEQRGITDSFRRSIELCKSAVGRIFVVNLVWIAGVVPVVMLAKVTWVVLVIASPVVCGVVRCVQMLAYADLRMRQGDYGQELRTDCARNTGGEELAGG
ncbi:hypothetical protein [[Mycobacterium] nativiensis]|uniref:Uncharacterized protein n=1 Tax=[Mycobacterium] nativiensis TaxID=2855503 RepID=A0ABU5XTL7_9MYCO|nr:hypothetical protein [Mycolicibacter sp. MYC340]MEB3031321.1 hypothetical protein [Mycolicibacter sp. MYC340]